MTYRAYIKNDYKPVIRWVPDRPWYLRRAGLSGGLIICVLLIGAFSLSSGSAPDARPMQETTLPINIVATAPKTESAATEADEHQPTPVPEFPVEKKRVIGQSPPPWQKVEVKKGESLSIIFERLGLSPTVLFQIMSLGESTRVLKELMPGQSLHFLIEGKKLQALRFESNLTTTLEIVKQEAGFSSNIIISPLDKRTNESHGTIDSSLFIAGQKAGLSDNLIMQLVSIFGWDIDFALDIRKGDQFNVIYEEHYKDATKVGEGPILAAEFVNRKQSYRAVRYISPEGETNYFSQDGISMRKAFLRTPLKFSRISSGFNLRRKHPVLNRIRAHKGVDYAAPTGTPIKATGDGTVLLAGKKGGYGNTVILKHGGTRSSLYAHMSRFSRNIKKWKRVKQGQIIGYVGKSGLATGPHLHYEFRVNGVHRNPLTVKLPKASSVPAKYLVDFKRQTATLLARLDGASTTKIATQNSKDNSAGKSVIALDDSAPVTRVVH